MNTRPAFLLGLVLAASVPLAGCYADEAGPVYAEGYEPQYYDGYVVYYDEDGYLPLRDFLKRLGVRHIILTGYATDMCFCKTTAGYENLSKDFNVFLVGDATLATFPANNTPAHATNAHISFASLNQLITQSSWIRFDSSNQARR